MLTKRIATKLEKKGILLESAINLFKTKGINTTTVSDIAKNAGVAKGTFYLYFKDKDEVVNKIIIMQASNILENALEKTKSLNTDDVAEKIIFIANEVIEAFVNSKQNIEIIHKNLYTGLFSNFENDENLFSKAVNEFIKQTNSYDIEKSQKKLYILTEMIGGVCYNSIYKNMPYSIDEIKPELFECIRSIVNN